MTKKKETKDLPSNSEMEDALLEALGYKTWEEAELDSNSKEEGPDFDCTGSRDAFFLNPIAVSAVLWVNLNLGFPHGHWGCQIQVAEQDVLMTLRTILEDGLNFSETMH